MKIFVVKDLATGRRNSTTATELPAEWSDSTKFEVIQVVDMSEQYDAIAKRKEAIEKAKSLKGKPNRTKEEIDLILDLLLEKL